MAERALDIFNLLSNLDRKNKFVWDNLTDDQRKEYAPLIAMRWMSGCDDQRQILYLNALMNQMVFVPGDHKELLMKIQAICGSGRTKRYQWVGIKAKSDKKPQLAIKVIKETFGYSTKVAVDYVDMFTQAEYIEMAEKLGWQAQEIKDLKKQVK